jgi:hypothetical protein
MHLCGEVKLPLSDPSTHCLGWIEDLTGEVLSTEKGRVALHRGL